MNAEMQNKKWLWAGIGLQFGTGYTVAFLIYQLGTLVTTGSLGTGFIPGLIAILVMAAVVVTIAFRANKKFDKEYSLHKHEMGETA